MMPPTLRHLGHETHLPEMLLKELPALFCLVIHDEEKLLDDIVKPGMNEKRM